MANIHSRIHEKVLLLALIDPVLVGVGTVGLVGGTGQHTICIKPS